MFGHHFPKTPDTIPDAPYPSRELAQPGPDALSWASYQGIAPSSIPKWWTYSEFSRAPDASLGHHTAENALQQTASGRFTS